MRMMMYRYKGRLERYIDILEALMKKHLTIDDVARKTNMSPSFVRRRVEFLIRNGLVEERTSSKEILYALTEKGKAVLRYLNFQKSGKVENIMSMKNKPMQIDPTITSTKKFEQFEINKIIAYIMLAVGVVSLASSAFYASSILAFIGLGLAFWGALLLYITPTRYVKLDLLNAIAPSTLVNIEKMLTSSKLNGKGIYLPPKYLKDFESSLIFIPSKANQTLPKPEEIDEEKLYSENPEGLFITPPGLALSKLFEKELGTSFTKTDVNYIQNNLPKLLIEDMEIAENVEVEVKEDLITVEITKHIFSEICEEIRKLPKTHETIGCILSSAIACALAKATGKPITIEKEELSEDGKTTKIQYRILED
jgi:predicted transcriptional regulator/uncharacterized protein YuzE